MGQLFGPRRPRDEPAARRGGEGQKKRWSPQRGRGGLGLAAKAPRRVRERGDPETADACRPRPPARGDVTASSSAPRRRGPDRRRPPPTRRRSAPPRQAGLPPWARRARCDVLSCLAGDGGRGGRPKKKRKGGRRRREASLRKSFRSAARRAAARFRVFPPAALGEGARRARRVLARAPADAHGVGAADGRGADARHPGRAGGAVGDAGGARADDERVAPKAVPRVPALRVSAHARGRGARARALQRRLQPVLAEQPRRRTTTCTPPRTTAWRTC